MKNAFLILVLLVVSIIGFGQKFDVVLDIKISPAELGKKINVASVYIYEDGVKIDSTVTQYGRCVFTLHEGHTYKALFQKTGYVGKHLLLETKDIPDHAKKRQVVKVEIVLFKERNGLDVEFLKEKPMGIARYESIYKKMKWDEDYTRIIEERIINATLDYSKKKRLGEIPPPPPNE